MQHPDLPDQIYPGQAFRHRLYSTRVNNVRPPGKKSGVNQPARGTKFPVPPRLSDKAAAVRITRGRDLEGQINIRSILWARDIGVGCLCHFTVRYQGQGTAHSEGSKQGMDVNPIYKTGSFRTLSNPNAIIPKSTQSDPS